jgi:hypothetical protein
MASAVLAADAPPRRPGQEQARTSFQTHQPWNPLWDIRADVVMAYGIEPDLPDRLKSYMDRGYIPQVMTGVSWGEYQDYLYGRFDGKNHEDAAQQRENGEKISHGGDVYYMVPEEPFGRFLSQGVKRAIDAGAQAIYLEEPEFWTAAGWSPAFKREWKDYFKEDWQPPNSSPEARYRSGELKYYLYKRALGQVFAFVHDYSKQIGRDVKCYVPTHSMLNYASWGIVSPESSLATLPGCDGYIAQVWTGTARTPNFYNGVKQERTFETAFLEYGSMDNLARATGRRMIFLADPIEDNPRHSWADYVTNYRQTLVASLLWPNVSHYEIVPWPERVFRGEYPTKDISQRKPDEPVEKEPIPADYSTELMTVFESLRHMDQKDVEWHAAAHGVGVLVSDSLMFHRGGPEDPGGDLSHIYGQMLPLLKRGVAVEPVQLENVALKDYLKPFKVLYLTYNGQKPMGPEPHDALAKWVKGGGVLVLMVKPDPFSKIRGWWNTAPNTFATPEDALLVKLGLPSGVPETDALVPVGKGYVLETALDPKAVAENGKADLAHFLDLTGQAFDKAGLKQDWKNALWLRRGPYVAGAVMEESVSTEPLRLSGRFVDLFDADLSIVNDPYIAPGTRFLMVDLAHTPKAPAILASASGTYDVKTAKDSISFRAIGPDKIQSAIRLKLPAPPKSVDVKDAKGATVDATTDWDDGTRTLLLRFPNSPEGVDLSVKW